MIILDLPAPPSVNQVWRASHKNRRFYKDKTYRAWIMEAGKLWLVQRAKLKLKSITGEFLVTIIVSEKFYGKRDLDNFAKATLDLLKSLQITADDRHCRKLVVIWAQDIPSDIRVVVEAA